MGDRFDLRVHLSQGFTPVPQATVARDGTVSPAAGGNYFGSHCRGNRIPRSVFSAPVGTGINGSYASDAGWERDGKCYMRGTGTTVVGFYMERELQTTWHGNGNGIGNLNGNGNGN